MNNGSSSEGGPNTDAVENMTGPDKNMPSTATRAKGGWITYVGIFYFIQYSADMSSSVA